LNKELIKRSLLIVLIFAILGALFSFLAKGGGKLIGYAAFALIIPAVWYQQKEMGYQRWKKQITRRIITKKFTTGSNRKKTVLPII